MVGVTVTAAGNAHRHDGSFIDDKLSRAHALAVMRVDGERRHDDGVFLLRLFHDVFLRDDVFTDHAAAFADVELRRPMIVIGKLVFAEPDLRVLLANCGRHGGIGAEEVVHLQGILLVRLPDLCASGLIRFAPAVAGSHQAHGELFSDAVIRVEFVPRQRIQIPQQMRSLFLCKVST